MSAPETFHISDYLEILSRRRKTIVVFFIATVLTVAVGTFLMEPLYEATAILLIDIESPKVVATGGIELDSQSATSYYSYREYYKSQMEIITSNLIIRQVFNEFNLGNMKEYNTARDPIKKFKKSVSVGSVRDTRLLNLSVQNKDPLLAAKIANRIAELYIKHNLDYISKGESLNLLKNEYLRLEAKLAEYSKIYKWGHPEMIRLKEEMADVVRNIAREKEASFSEEEFNTEKMVGQFRRALAGLKANNVSIVEPAESPLVPIKPKKLLNLFLAVFIGLFGGVGLALFFEYQDLTVRDAEDIERLTDWTFIGKVPVMQGPKKEFNVQLKPDDYITEAYKTIRTQVLLLDTKDRPLKTIVVSSLGPQEGKTITVCNLAIALAQSQKRVLLVDADMRRPRLHEVFKKKEERGLCAYLSRESGYEELIHKTDIGNLSYIADGRSCGNSTELLSGERMKEFVAGVKKNFDIVLFDTPPLGIVSDATLMSTMVDGIILIVESGKTPQKAVARCHKLLKNSYAGFVGVIINKAVIGGQESYYYAKSYSAHPGK